MRSHITNDEILEMVIAKLKIAEEPRGCSNEQRYMLIGDSIKLLEKLGADEPQKSSDSV